MWSDNESEIDLLGCTHLVRGVKSIVERDDLLPATIGVFGDWGSGKSTVLGMIASALNELPKAHVVHFNGWLFEGYEDAKTALMGTILDTVAEKQSLPQKAKSVLEKLVKRVQWMRLAWWGTKTAGGTLALTAGGVPLLGAAAVGASASTILEKAGDLDVNEAHKVLGEAAENDGRRGLREFRADFDSLLEQAGIQRLVVIIDDLDRCLPDTVIETLEAIKLFLFVPRTAFVIGADERLVKYAVRHRFPKLTGEQAEVGRDYLEKIIQFPVRIPPLGRPELETYINLLFAKNGRLTPVQFEQIRARAVEARGIDTLFEVRINHGLIESVVKSIPSELDEELAIAARIAPLLATGMNGNPRQCKRFLNMLVMRVAMADARGIELKQRVLAKLMLLEYFKPESYRKLAEAQAEQDGKPLELARSEATAMGSMKAREEADEDDEPPATQPTWLADPWIQDWLRMQPNLSQEDLRPYVFFSRDTLGPVGGTVQRMTPEAQQALASFFQGSEAVREVAIRRSKSLPPADAAAVFEELCDRARREEDLSDETSAFRMLRDFTGSRPELFSQFVTFLTTLPATTVPVSIVPKLQSMAGDDGARLEAVKGLLGRWANGASGRLQRAAKKRLEKL